MKCPKCGGNGFVPTNVFGVNGAIKCDFCGGTGVFITNAVEPMTNEEWFDTLSTTEEKAEAIYKCVMANSWSFSKDGIKRWLKQPHREERKK
jgi:hypothetical protein